MDYKLVDFSSGEIGTKVYQLPFDLKNKNLYIKLFKLDGICLVVLFLLLRVSYQQGYPILIFIC